MKHIVFDFDGVLFDTNKLKFDCFISVASKNSFTKLEVFEDYCRKAGGITAEERFQYYLKNIDNSHNLNADKLTDEYRKLVRKKILYSVPSPYLERLVRLKRFYKLSIISGGNKAEIVSLLSKNNFDHIFNGLILGNPLSKDENFSLFCTQYDPEQCVYVGDSILDFELASKYKMKFRFIYDWTDVEDYEKHPALKNTIQFPNISEVIKEFEALAKYQGE